VSNRERKFFEDKKKERVIYLVSNKKFSPYNMVDDLVRGKSR